MDYLSVPQKKHYRVIDQERFSEQVFELLRNSKHSVVVEKLNAERPQAFPENFDQTLQELDTLIRLAPNLRDFIKLVISLLKLHPTFSLQHPFRCVPILLLGPPGVGKTFIANKVAQAMGIDCLRINLSNATESFVLSGCPQGYSSSCPGDVALRMSEAKCINPTIILDELDKANFASGDRPSIVGPLLQMLEPETARYFEDSALKCELNISRVSWLATANSLEGIPETILSRLHIISVGQATDEEKRVQIDYFTQSTLKEMGLHNRVQVSVSSAAVEQFLHLDVRAWKMKLRLVIALKINTAKPGEALIVEATDIKALSYETARRPIGFVR